MTTIECHKKPYEAYQSKDEVNQCLEGRNFEVVFEEVDNDLRYAVMYLPPSGRKECVGNARTLTGVLETIKRAMGSIAYDQIFMASKLKASKATFRDYDDD